MHEESNLADGKEPIKFSVFIDEKYLPRYAKPNLKPNSYDREADSAKALKHFFGDTWLHKIDLDRWDTYKTGRLEGKLDFSKKKCANTTVDKEFDVLRRSLSYGVQLALIKHNPLLGVKGLKGGTRRHIWLKKSDIERMLSCAEPWLAGLLEFRVMTGARPGETVLFGEENLNIERDEFWVHTFKRRNQRDVIVKRYFSISSMGPRFARLLARLKAHPVSRLYFCDEQGAPHKENKIQHAFARVRQLASLKHIIPYDLRGTFAMHRAIVVKNFRQLQTEMGHLNPNSIQSYLDEAVRFRKEDSIFYEPEPQSSPVAALPS